MNTQILIDFSGVMIPAALQAKDSISIDLFRHIVINNILFYKRKFKVNNNDVILCMDGTNYWRKQIFPLYKQQRKVQHEKSDFDWDGFFKLFNQIKIELKEETPFNVMEISGCEADDIIAVLSGYVKDRSVIIVSSDKDLIQLQAVLENHTIKQWSPYHKGYLTGEKYSLFEHVVRGDSADGIPNILSDDDVFMVAGKRSKQIRETQLLKWKSSGFENDELAAVFSRNQKLIDLRCIPEEYKTSILNEYNEKILHKEERNFKSVSLFNYLVKYKLSKIIDTYI